KSRKFSVIPAFVLIIALLAGCSGNQTDANQNKSENDGAGGKKEKVELSLWLTPQWKGVFDATESNADYDSFFKYAADKFSKQYENYDVKVNVQVVAGDQRDELLNVNLNGGTPPDVFFESV